MNLELVEMVIDQYRESLIQKDTTEQFLLRMNPLVNKLSAPEYKLLSRMLLSTKHVLTTTH